MSLELARQVDREHPELLQRNLGETCHQFTVHLIELLRAKGHDAFHVCKTRGEGQYVPFGFQPRDVIGLDGKTYRCTGLSHDALWVDDVIVDTIGSANEHERPIYRIPGSTDVSFDPASGPQIRAFPVWNMVPREDWRPWNPPLTMAPVVLPPSPPPSSKILSKGEAYAALQALNAFYAAPEGLQRPGGMVLYDEHGRAYADVEALGQWQYQMVVEGISLEDVKTQIRGSMEWREKHPDGH